MDERAFLLNRARAVDYLNFLDAIFVFDGYANWDPNARTKIRVICARPYHALFMHNMLIRPTAEELETYGEPDFVIYNAGAWVALCLCDQQLLAWVDVQRCVRTL